jgi:osmotically-inducible protein OsmY
MPSASDDLLKADVCEALYNSAEFRLNDAFLHIEVTVRDHVVALRGNVRTLWRSLLAETIARRVRGVWNVQNELVGDDELEDAVQQTLRRDSGLRLPPLHTPVMFGEVTLYGQVRTAEDAAMVVFLVRRVPGVRSIDNQLIVTETAYRLPSMVDGHVLFAARRPMRTGAG